MAVKMEAECFSQTLVDIYQSARSGNPEEQHSTTNPVYITKFSSYILINTFNSFYRCDQPSRNVKRSGIRQTHHDDVRVSIPHLDTVQRQCHESRS